MTLTVRLDPDLCPLPDHDTECSESHLGPVPVLKRGDCISGKYLIGDVLGKGGFAVVYDAEHLGLQCRMAIKVLHVTHETPEILVARFREEARISAMIHHRHVLNVHDTGTLDDGSPYLVMEHIHGETLHARIGRGTLPIAEVLSIACQLLRALCALAELGIVHRDVKPDNVMLHTLSDGQPIAKLLDFGIARKVDRGLSGHPTLLMGTPHYMSPEHLRGEPATLQFDIYSAGVVLYEALVGNTPYDADGLSDLVFAVLHEHPPAIRHSRPDCPRELLQIVTRAMHRDPLQRYPTARAMLQDLEACKRALAATATHDGNQGESLDPPGHQAAPSTLPAPPIAPPRPSRAMMRLRRGLATCAAGLFFCVLGPGIETSGSAPAHPSQLVLATLGTSTTKTPTRVDQLLTSSVAHALGSPSERAGSPSERSGFLADSHPAIEEPAPSLRADRSRARKAGEPHMPPRAPLTHKTAAIPSIPGPSEQALQVDARSTLSAALTSYIRGEHAKAYGLYQHHVALRPNDVMALRGLGIVAARIGRTREARQALERYLVLSPSANDVDAVRARLRALPQVGI